MRPAVLAGFALAVLPAAAAAQTTPYAATVADTRALLRAGPSDKYPETGTLPRGIEVKVDHEEPTNVVNLMDALRASVKGGAAASSERRKPGRTGTAKKAGRTKTRSRKAG